MKKQIPSTSSTPGPVWVGEAQVSAITDMSLAWLRKKRITGGGIPYSKMGRTVKYRLDIVQEYMEQRMVSSTSEYQSNHKSIV